MGNNWKVSKWILSEKRIHCFLLTNFDGTFRTEEIGIIVNMTKSYFWKSIYLIHLFLNNYTMKFQVWVDILTRVAVI